jgi:hypothetical protein
MEPCPQPMGLLKAAKLHSPPRATCPPMASSASSAGPPLMLNPVMFRNLVSWVFGASIPVQWVVHICQLAQAVGVISPWQIRA